MRRLQRNKQQEHVDSEGSWAISYGDMITLLLSFFVLYFTVDHEKVRANQLRDSLVVKLNEAGVKPEFNGFQEKMQIGEVPGDHIDPTIMQKLGAKVYEEGEKLIVDFENVSFFNLSAIELTIDGANALSKFSKIYQPFSGGYQLGIRAFTDTRQVRHTAIRYRDNLELSALRSVAAMRVLQKAGIPLDRMKLGGFGEMMETQEVLRKLASLQDPLKYSRKVVLVIEPAQEKNK